MPMLSQHFIAMSMRHDFFLLHFPVDLPTGYAYDARVPLDSQANQFAGRTKVRPSL